MSGARAGPGRAAGWDGASPALTLWTSAGLVFAGFVAATALALAAGGTLDQPANRLAVILPLLALSVIDARAYWLPFSVTLPLAGLGLVAATLAGNLAEAACGLGLWGALPCAIALASQRLRGHPGLGMGDVALTGAIGAWLGPVNAAVAIALASFGAIAAHGIVRFGGLARSDAPPRLPLGPFLCFGLWGTLVLTG